MIWCHLYVKNKCYLFAHHTILIKVIFILSYKKIPTDKIVEWEAVHQKAYNAQFWMESRRAVLQSIQKGKHKNRLLQLDPSQHIAIICQDLYNCQIFLQYESWKTYRKMSALSCMNRTNVPTRTKLTVKLMESSIIVAIWWVAISQWSDRRTSNVKILNNRSRFMIHI